MAVLPLNLARVSNLMRSNVALSQIDSTQSQMLQVQNELTTGKKVNTPSDDPAAAAMIQSIQKTLEQRDSYDANLTAAKNQLSSVDTTLGDMTDLLNQAQTLASANVGDDVTQDSRDAAATQIDSIYSQLLDIGNKEFEGSYVFGGDKQDQPPFVEENGGVKFVGSADTLSNQVDESTDSSFQVDGADVWGALSSRIDSKPLSPNVESASRLSQLNGASGNGIDKGQILISNGTDSAKVDLSGADTLGDVVDAINAAKVGGITASLNATGTGLKLTGAAGDAITVDEVAGRTAASDLGILTKTSPGAGVPIEGAALSPRLTNITPLSSLNGGTGIDPKGLTITNGGKTAKVDLSGAKDVEDVMNAVNGANVGVEMSISPDGTKLRLLNTTQGTSMTVAENGGTTAADLGLRSFTADSKLAELNDGAGVRTVDGKDFSVTDSAGKTFDVDLSASDKTVQNVIDKINAAASAAGAAVTASFGDASNGIVLTDSAGGGGTTKVTAQNGSLAAKDLGIDGPAAGGVISGRDVNPVQADGIFANLNAMRVALRANDKAGLTKAAEAVKADYDRVSRTHGDVGARVKAIDARQDRLADQNVSTKALLSQLQDTDFAAAATQYSMLQTSLDASMRTTSTMLSLSLMDFLK